MKILLCLILMFPVLALAQDSVDIVDHRGDASKVVIFMHLGSCTYKKTIKITDLNNDAEIASIGRAAKEHATTIGKCYE